MWKPSAELRASTRRVVTKVAPTRVLIGALLGASLMLATSSSPSPQPAKPTTAPAAKPDPRLHADAYQIIEPAGPRYDAIRELREFTYWMLGGVARGDQYYVNLSEKGIRDSVSANAAVTDRESAERAVYAQLGRQMSKLTPHQRAVLAMLRIREVKEPTYFTESEVQTYADANKDLTTDMIKSATVVMDLGPGSEKELALPMVRLYNLESEQSAATIDNLAIDLTATQFVQQLREVARGADLSKSARVPGPATSLSPAEQDQLPPNFHTNAADQTSGLTENDAWAVNAATNGLLKALATGDYSTAVANISAGNRPFLAREGMQNGVTDLDTAAQLGVEQTLNSELTPRQRASLATVAEQPAFVSQVLGDGSAAFPFSVTVVKGGIALHVVKAPGDFDIARDKNGCPKVDEDGDVEGEPAGAEKWLVDTELRDLVEQQKEHRRRGAPIGLIIPSATAAVPGQFDALPQLTNKPFVGAALLRTAQVARRDETPTIRTA